MRSRDIALPVVREILCVARAAIACHKSVSGKGDGAVRGIGKDNESILPAFFAEARGGSSGKERGAVHGNLERGDSFAELPAALEHKDFLVGCKGDTGCDAGHKVVVVAACEYEQHGYVALRPLQPVVEYPFRFFELLGRVHEDVHFGIILPEPLDPLEDTVVIAHVAKTARREEKDNLRRDCRLLRLVLFFRA